MGYISAIILGLVEGLTEFLPISSSGHLLVARAVMHIPLAGTLTFDAILQCATTLAIVIYFWRDIWEVCVSALRFVTRKPLRERDRTLVVALCLGTIPAVIFGLLLEKQMDTLFRNIHLVAVTLLLGSFLMWRAQVVGEKKSHQRSLSSELQSTSSLTVAKGVAIGFFQSLALVPGISRSGATISGGLLSGLSQEEAVRFSFLLSVPVLVGSGLKKILELHSATTSVGALGPLVLGSIVAFVVGLLAIHYFIRFLKNHNLTIFIWYRVVLACGILLFL